jgi:CelD/BcsL family acetyltransferase involved in cellulose biosynthesis
MMFNHLISMTVFEIDPLADPRWRTLVDHHPRASVFHTAEWLEALVRTYSYKPVAFTTAPAGAPLKEAIVLCRIRSWLTGTKWISLPFSDHCEPLVEDPAALSLLASAIRDRVAGQARFAEIRPMTADLAPAGWTAQDRYCFHSIDLRPPLEDIHARLHKDGVQRKIRRAEREGIVVEQGRSDSFLEQFFKLMVFTRRRHGIPPQPFAWFRNLRDCLGPRFTIYLARVNGSPIASVLTLRHGQTAVYKYGCSDERLHNMGGMPRLFWQVIQDFKSQEVAELDLGRSDIDNEGLIRFKDHLGAAKTTLQYWQYSKQPLGQQGFLGRALKSPTAQNVLARLPDPLFRLAGQMLYRHAG